MTTCEWCGVGIGWSGGACSVPCQEAVARVMDGFAKSEPLVKIAERLQLDPVEVDRIIGAASKRIYDEAQGDGFTREWARAVLAYRRYEQYWAGVAMDEGLGEDAPSVRNKASDNQHKALAALDKLHDVHSPDRHVEAALPAIELEFVNTGHENEEE